MDQPPVGSLVAPSPKYRVTMETGDGAALLLSTRRGSAHLYYPSADRGFWVPLRQVGTVPADVLPDDCLERVVSDLLLYLCADECEVEYAAPGELQLAVRIPRLSRTQLTVILGALGEMVGDLRFDPGNMSGVTLRLELVSLPEAAAAGR